MAKKQLIVVVEGTAAIAPFWHTIASDYLKDIVRNFCGNESMDRKPSMPQAELSMVVFNARGPYNGCLVQRNRWTSDMGLFFQWLSSIAFAGGGFNDAAIAEGLAEALMMFMTGNKNQNMDGQRHCILVAGSNPEQLPTPVYRPQTSSDCNLSDAEGLAKSFAQYAISLSVISPKKLPKLKAIYHAGKSDPQVADPPEDNNDKNPQFLVLISDNFMEARAALSRSRMLNLPSNQNPVKMEVTPVGMSQPTQPGMQPVGMSAMQAGKQKNVKFWEGMLSGRPEGQLVVMARIEGYKNASKSDNTLASNWPQTLEIVDFISLIDMRNMLLNKAEMILFHTTEQHLLLSKFQNLAWVIRLPSQTLLVSFSNKPRILIGGILPGDTVLLKSTTPAEERSAPGETSEPEEKPARPIRKRKTSAKARQ